MSGSSLLTLPDELLENIFTYLHPLQIVLCRRINKIVLSVIDASPELQFRIELATDGYLVSHRSSKPAKILLEEVTSTREAFDALKPQWRWKVNSPESRHDHYEVCDGVWGKCTNRFNNSPFRSMHYEELLPPQLSPNRWQYTVEDAAMDVIDFSYWLAEDLQILMEWKEYKSKRHIHFRTLSTNVPHPSAAQPFFEIRYTHCPIWRYCLTLAHKEYVAILFSDFEHQGDVPVRKGAAIVVNWKTGEVHLPCTETADLAFLSDNQVLLLHTGESATHSFSIEVYSLDLRMATHTLLLPTEFARPSRMRFLTHPPYSSKSPHSNLNPPHSEFIDTFIPDPELDILPLDFKVHHLQGPSFFIILSMHLLQRKLESLSEGEQTNDQEGGTKMFTRTWYWPAWGPEVSRWLPVNQLLNLGFRSTYGSKMIALGNLDLEVTDTPELSAHEGIVMIDFNPRPIRRFGLTTCEEDRYKLIVESQTQKWWNLTQEPIYSFLPFRAWSSKIPCQFLDVHMMQNTLICRRDHSYTLFCFLPRDLSTHPLTEEEEGENLESL